MLKVRLPAYQGKRAVVSKGAVAVEIEADARESSAARGNAHRVSEAVSAGAKASRHTGHTARTLSRE